jgi:hypothetical protein
MAIETGTPGGFPQQEGDGEEATTGTTTGTTLGTTLDTTDEDTTTGDGHPPRVSR